MIVKDEKLANVDPNTPVSFLEVWGYDIIVEKNNDGKTYVTYASDVLDV
jgi:hypothetical protein